jgi:hypothetical protein
MMESNIFILPTTFIIALLSMDKSAGVKRVNIFQDLLPLSEDTTKGRLLLAKRYIEEQMMSQCVAAIKACVDYDKLRRL